MNRFIPDIKTVTELKQYRKELEDELLSILKFWETKTADKRYGGFYGKIDNSGKVFLEAPKGSVLNSRILWTFSAAFNLNTNEKEHLHLAHRAYEYIVQHFLDKKYGGVYWSVDSKGNPADSKKQIYALAFAIYAFSEYFLCSENDDAKEAAIDLYKLIIEKSYDKKNSGYIEALTREWQEIKDLRVSEKDANEKKSMNTHLHLLEAFAGLYRIWANEDLKEKIRELIAIFSDRIIDRDTHHLILFFDEKWDAKSNTISYGHDIEASWLIQDCAEIIAAKDLLEKVKAQSVSIADAASEGLDKDGGLWYEYQNDSNHLIKEKHWWPQAESMVGFFNAWQVAGDETYLEKSKRSWQFIKDHIIDKKYGEWFWGVNENYSVMNEDKAGIWKCPYHNSRACIELIRRIDQVEHQAHVQ